jgi:hypothetical protein
LSAVRALPLCLGPLSVEGRPVQRSGIRWLREDGAPCAAGEVVGYCNLALRSPGRPREDGPFAGEQRDLQLAIATPVAGRLRVPPPEAGGFGDVLAGLPWRAQETVAAIECSSDAQVPREALEARLTLIAGQRMTELAEVRHGLGTGWHGVSRAAHVDHAPPAATLLSMGICEMEPVIKGARHAFLEMMQAIPGPAQLVLVSDQVLVPSARVIAEQIARTPQQLAAIAESLRGFIAGDAGNPDADGWFMAAALLKMLAHSPVTQGQDVLCRAGAMRGSPPQALLVSLHAEHSVVLRHRTLGYTLAFHPFRLREAGTAFQQWLRDNFEVVRRAPGDIAQDYEALIRAMREHAPGTRLIVSNVISSSASDDVQCYQGLDARLASVRGKTLNLVLAALEQQHGVAVLDVDAIAADVGIGRHSGDGVHHDGVMAHALRGELLALLAALQ